MKYRWDWPKIASRLSLAAIFFLLGCTERLSLDGLTQDDGESTWAQQRQASSHTLIMLDRSACYGGCPVYYIMIRGDGSVEYEGIANVKVKGERTAKLDANQLDALIYEFGKADFYSLEENYTSSMTDLATTTTTISINGNTKVVQRYGCGPAALLHLELLIDEMVNAEQWVGEHAMRRYPESACVEPAGPFTSPLR